MTSEEVQYPCHEACIQFAGIWVQELVILIERKMPLQHTLHKV